MPSPKSGYYNKSGIRVPSVTTVISRFKDSGALIYWAWNMAYDPYRQLRAWSEKALREADCMTEKTFSEGTGLLSVPPEKYDFRAVRDKAASIGTVVHARVDCWVRGSEFNPAQFVSEEIQDPAAASELGFEAFKQWAGSTNFKLEEGEIQLVSEKYNYGGTPDIVLVRGEKTIGDWKSGDLYPEQVLPQLAAYHKLLVENGRELSGGAHAISINKKTGGFTHRYFTPEEMDIGWNVFSLMRELYGLIKEIK